jgi:hypothetical protein
VDYPLFALVGRGVTALVFGPAHGRLDERWSGADHRLAGAGGSWLRVAAWSAQLAPATVIVGRVA